MSNFFLSLQNNTKYFFSSINFLSKLLLSPELVKDSFGLQVTEIQLELA